MRPVTLITGASAGIGTALAHEFARHGHELLLIARREQRLAELADAIAAQGHKRPLLLPIDLGAPDAVGRIADALARLDVEPDTVVNNAGFGLVGAAAKLDLAEQLAMIDLNVRVLTDLSLAFVATLQRHSGGILNVASVAGFLPGPGMAVYYATKAYVISFSEALVNELKKSGVTVTCFCPGATETGFATRAGNDKTRLFQKFGPMNVKTVAADGYRGLMKGKTLVISGTKNWLVAESVRFAPRKVVTAISRWITEEQK